MDYTVHALRAMVSDETVANGQILPTRATDEGYGDYRLNLERLFWTSTVNDILAIDDRRR
jgi:hypothetical protein